MHSSIVAEFTQAFVAYTQKLKLGDGLAEGTTLGPLANARRLTAMAHVVDDARQRGAEVLTGGERVGDAGNFFAPTIITNLTTEADLFNNEPFGPVAAVRGFDTIEEALKEANRLPYGLASYAFTQSLKTAHQLATGIEVGMLWINQGAVTSADMPFGGVKDSGYGSEGGQEALEAYLVTKTVAMTSL